MATRHAATDTTSSQEMVPGRHLPRCQKAILPTAHHICIHQERRCSETSAAHLCPDVIPKKSRLQMCDEGSNQLHESPRVKVSRSWDAHSNGLRPYDGIHKYLGLKPAYVNDESVHLHIKKLSSLPFLPANQIQPLFNNMTKDVSGEWEDVPAQLLDFLKYIQATWMTNNVWSPPAWSVFGQRARTNNDVEGYHNRLNSRVWQKRNACVSTVLPTP